MILYKHSRSQRLYEIILVDGLINAVHYNVIKTEPIDLGMTINPLIPTLKLQSNGPLYRNTVIGTLAIDGWAVTFGTVRGGAPSTPLAEILFVPQASTLVCLMAFLISTF